MSSKPIIIYRNQPIPLSETFVFNQSFALQRHKAHILGAKYPKTASIRIPPDRVRVVNNGGLKGWINELRWKVLGKIPLDILDWAKSLNPLLIHAHFGPDGVVAMPLANKLNIPLIVSFHGTDATKRPSYVWFNSYMTHRLYWLRKRKLTRSVDRAIVQSNYLKKVIIDRHGFKPEKVVCIPLGTDIRQFAPKDDRTEWGHILYTGRLVERKGLPFLIKAIQLIINKYPAVHLTVIGDGPQRKNYEFLAKKLLGPKVTFLGAQPQTVVRDYLEKAYMFCMPSVTMPSGEVETLGMVFVEAMAMKVPPLSFYSGGIPEVISHGKTGFLAKERDVEGLAKYISLLLGKPELQKKLGANGRNHVIQNFNLKIQNEKIESLYSEIITNQYNKKQNFQ